MTPHENTVRNIFPAQQPSKASGEEGLPSESNLGLLEQDDMRTRQEQKVERARQEQKAKMVVLYRKQLVKLPFLTEKVYQNYGAIHSVRDKKAIITRLAEVLADSPVAEELLKDKVVLRDQLALIIQKEFSGKDSAIETDADTSVKDEEGNLNNGTETGVESEETGAEGIEERGIHGRSLHGRGNPLVAALPEALSTDATAEVSEGTEGTNSLRANDSLDQDTPETAFIDAKKIDQIEDYIRDQWEEKKEVRCNVRGERGTLERALILGFTMGGKFKVERENGTDIDVTAAELIELNPSLLVASERLASSESSASRPVLVEGEPPRASGETEPALTDHETQGESTPTQEQELSKQGKFLREIFGDTMTGEQSRELWEFFDGEVKKFRRHMRAWMKKEEVPEKQRLGLLMHPKITPSFLDNLIAEKIIASGRPLSSEVEKKLRLALERYIYQQ